MLEASPGIIRVVVVEDNRDSLEKLTAMLLEFDFIELVGSAQSGRDGVTVVNEERPDLLFLDIKLPGMDGFDLLKNLRHPPMVIFISAYDDYAVKAFEVNGLDYLLKPVSKKRLQAALERATNLKTRLDPEIVAGLREMVKKMNRDRLFSVKEGDQILLIPQDEVYYFKSEDRYVFLYTGSRRYFYNSTLKKLSGTLDPQIFLRVNRSCIVSLNKIKKLKKSFLHDYKLILADGGNTALRISKNHLPELKERLNIHLKI